MKKFTIEQFIKFEKREERKWASNGYEDDCRIPDLIDIHGNRVVPYEADEDETYFIVRSIGFLGKCKRTNWATVEKVGYTKPYTRKEIELALENRLNSLLRMTSKVVIMDLE